MPRERCVAAAQSVSVRGDVDANLEQHLRLARAAAREGVRVLVFPELSLTGYELELARELAFTERDPRLQPLSDLAALHDMTLVVGAPALLADRLHIGAFLVSPDGSLGLYTKQRLGAFEPGVQPGAAVPLPEASVFEPGSRDPLLCIDGVAAAIAVCADTGRPSHPERAAHRGAGLYLASMFVIPGDLETESARLRSHALQHSLGVVFANHGGPTGGLDSAGCSSIWSERGELLARLDGCGAGLVLAHGNAQGWSAAALPLGDGPAAVK